MATEEPPFEELADDEDELGWSWDELTGGVRTEATDEEAAAYALFAGVPENQVKEVKRQYEELFK